MLITNKISIHSQTLQDMILYYISQTNGLKKSLCLVLLASIVFQVPAWWVHSDYKWWDFTKSNQLSSSSEC